MYGYDDSEIRRLSELIDEIRRIRYRTCEPKNNSNPRYHALSMVIRDGARMTVTAR